VISKGGLWPGDGEERADVFARFDGGGDSGQGSSTSMGGGAGGDLGDEESGEMTGECKKGEEGTCMEGGEVEEEELAALRTCLRAVASGERVEGFAGGERDLRWAWETKKGLEGRGGSSGGGAEEEEEEDEDDAEAERRDTAGVETFTGEIARVDGVPLGRLRVRESGLDEDEDGDESDSKTRSKSVLWASMESHRELSDVD
jgi:hypothetical protein